MAIYIKNDGPTLRISPALAIEIGFVQSVILLQVDYLCESRGKALEGQTGKWIKKSQRSLIRECFPFWSKSTLQRAMQEMSDDGILEIFLPSDAKLNAVPWTKIGPNCNLLQSIRMDEEILVKVAAPEKKKAKPKPAKKVDEGIYQLAVALAEVCRIDFEMNKGRMLGQAKPLKGKTAEEIRALFGYPNGLWYKLDFRGKAGSPPSPSQVTTEWMKLSTAGTLPGAAARGQLAKDGGLDA